MFKTKNIELIEEYIEDKYYALIGGHDGAFWVINDDEILITKIDELDFYTTYSDLKEKK